ncbi:MAG TPA: hypothetical protein VHT94_16050, partial [Streptosporangiaceae bacterium]|nr:hypothetical protein [Streptosporangiaceae bacterium]
GAGPTGTHRTGSGQPGTGGTGTGQAGQGQAGPGHTSSGRSDSGHAGSGQSSPGQPHSGHSGSGRTSPGHSSPGHTSPGHSSPGQSRPGQAGSSPSRTGQSGTGRSTTPAAPHPRRSAPAPGGGGATRHPRPGVVSITPSLAGRADARQVAGLLVRYFAAVNHRRYRAYASLFAQRRQLTPGEFAWGYRTSHDSNAALVGIAALKGGLKATVTFTSHQDPAQSPDHSSCIDWRITLFLHRLPHGAEPTYLIGMPPPGYRAGLQACRFAPGHSARGHSSHRTARHFTATHRSSPHPKSGHSAPKHSTSRHSKHSTSRDGHRKRR